MTRVMFVGEMYYPDLSVGGGPVYPPAGGGGAPGYPVQLPIYPGQPSHPIAGAPPGIWGGPWLPPYVDAGLPGPQPPPGTPSHPIAQPPLGTWGGYRPPYVDIGGPGPQPPPGTPAHPWVPPQSPVVDPIDPTKAYIVAYMPASGGGYERMTFTVDIPPPGEPPTEATPKA